MPSWVSFKGNWGQGTHFWPQIGRQTSSSRDWIFQYFSMSQFMMVVVDPRFLGCSTWPTHWGTAFITSFDTDNPRGQASLESWLVSSKCWSDFAGRYYPTGPYFQSFWANLMGGPSMAKWILLLEFLAWSFWGSKFLATWTGFLNLCLDMKNSLVKIFSGLDLKLWSDSSDKIFN